MANSVQQNRSSSRTEWERLADTPEFKTMIRGKKRFIIPAVIFFLVYYFALPILNGYTDLLNVKVIGSINLVYLFALSQILMAWVLSLLYVRHANRMDRHAEKIAAGAKEVDR